MDRRQFVIASATAAGLSAISSPSVAVEVGRVRVTGLRVDHIDRPLGIDNVHPQLSWRLESDDRNLRQTAYRIVVSSTERKARAMEGDVWDSGKVKSSRSFGINYQGAPLKSRECRWWTVQVWDERNDVSLPSDPSFWEMGLLSSEDWSAHWLAIEDETTRADREAGLAWVWAPPALADQAGPWVFRLTIDVDEHASGGELVATVNDWHWWTQITRTWIDGKPVAGSGTWTSWHDARVYDRPNGLNSLAHQVIALPAMSRGSHMIAIEVAQGGDEVIKELFGNKPPVRALALFARVDVSSTRSIRFGRGTRWKVGLVQDAGANAAQPAVDDRSWSTAVSVNLGAFDPWPEKPARLLRHKFIVSKPILRGRLYATALGAYEARLNGARVGDALLTPEPAQYNKRVLYQTYDVTGQLRVGENVLGLIVGEGWYGGFDGRFPYASPPLRTLAQVEIDYADGTRVVITTGSGWRSAESPIRSSALKVGEVYDARFEQPGWDAPGFDDTPWSEVLTADEPAITLTAQVSAPVRATETLHPFKIEEVRAQTYVVDFGRIFAGWCRLRARGTAGQSIELKFADGLNPNGEVDQSHEVQDPTLAPRVDRFILKGDPRGELFEPHFSYRSFRYVEVCGLANPLTAEAIEGIVIHSDLKRTGWLRCSHSLVENIDTLLVNTQQANYVAIPTDNNIRELRGYLNDASCFWETGMFNCDMAAFTRRIMDNAADRQTSAGMFPKNAPEPPFGNAYFNLGMAPAGHASGSVVLPWRAWHQYGDTAIIDRFWTPMRLFLDFIHRENPDFLWKRNHINEDPDWLEGSGIPAELRAPTIPVEVFATAYWAHCVHMMAQMAYATARDSEAMQLQALQRQITNAFNSAYVSPDGTVGSGSQTCYVLALHFGLLPKPMRARAAERLVAEVERCGNAITTGTLATEFILDVLVDHGYSRLAYDLLLRTDRPSWGYMIRNGATGVWETWDNKRANSQPALGCIGGFIYRRIAGIAAGVPGFRTIVVRPVFDARITSGGGNYDSVVGRISTDWTRFDDGCLSLAVTIPPNASARVHLPASPTIHEGRKPIAGRSDIQVLQRSDSEVILGIGSGSYRFIVQ